MVRRIWLLVCLALCISISAFSQVATVQGTIYDSKENTPVYGATVEFSKSGVTAGGGVTGESGFFSIELNSAGVCLLKINYLGYEPLQREVVVTAGVNALGSIKLKASATELKTVNVTGQQTRAVQHGDTTQFNADAFKVHQDATAEDLVKKLPGVTSDNNGLKVNGEDVKKVLVDGKPFFGNDPSASLRNLPAEMISKIEVFDGKSDQARFTGFDDGQSQKTFNLITKDGKNEGQFGKFYGGYGTNQRYSAGGNYNLFKGDQRLSIIGMSNNVNQQNFSIDDIMGVMSNSGGMGGGMGPTGPPPGQGGSRSNSASGGSGPGNLFVDQQSGLTKTNSLGVNYTDNWGKKLAFSGSYFMNQTDNDNQSNSNRRYFSDTDQVYKESRDATTANLNHRVNLKLEYSIDSANTITVSPQLRFQKNENKSELTGQNYFSGSETSSTVNTQTTNNTGYYFSNSLLYMHKFRKKGRTVSLDLGTEYNKRDNSGDYISTTTYSDQPFAALIDQEYGLKSNTTTYSGNITYTEPLGKYSQLLISYAPSLSKAVSDKQTVNLNTLTGQYTDIDTNLSNKFESEYSVQKGGIGYRYTKSNLNLTLNANVQNTNLDAQQTFPVSQNINRSFNNVLPSAMLNYKISPGKNLRLMYRSAANVPSIDQLQNVVNNSNPLQLTSGNSDLRQTSEHTLFMNYGATNAKTSRNFFTVLIGSYVNDYISNATFIPRNDTLINGYVVSKGSQLTMPVNMDGKYSARGFAVYSLPVKPIKSNLSIIGGVTYALTPSLINSVVNNSDDLTFNGGFNLGSNISSNLDFTLSYNGSYNSVTNTSQNNTSYVQHKTTAKLTWIFLKGFVVNTDITSTVINGLASGFDQNYLVWNAYVGYKFFKDKQLEAKVSVFDLLNQNRNVSRNISNTYTEDSYTNTLNRYFMVSLTYTLRKFKGSAQAPKLELMPGMPPPGSLPPPGGG
jgi:hypothetical protein